MSRPSPSALLRLALTPRWLVAAGLVLVFAVGAVLLGRWQWDRTQTILEAERAAIAQAVPVEDVFAGEPAGDVPSGSIGRPVLVSGSYEPNMQTVVTGREHEGEPGVWIVTGARLGDGRVVAVLRGSLSGATSPGAQVPEGEVRIQGVLQPDETFYADAQIAAGTAAAISHDRLAQQWSADVLPGFVVLTSSDPDPSPAPVPVIPTVQTADVPFPLQNFVYAFQWWVFALFGFAVYARWLWLEARRSGESADAEPLEDRRHV